MYSIGLTIKNSFITFFKNEDFYHIYNNKNSNYNNNNMSKKLIIYY